MPVARERRFMKNAITGRKTLAPSMRTANRPQALPLAARPWRMRAPASSGRRVSAWRNTRTSPRASAAPAFIWLARRRGAETTRAAAPGARSVVLAVEPPSTTMTSWPRGRSGASAANDSEMTWASFNTGTMMEIHVISISAAPPGVKLLRPPEQLLRGVRPLPVACRVLVGFGERRVNMNGTEDLVQADSVFHRRDEFDDEVGRVFPDDRRAEDPVPAGNGEDLDRALRLPVGDRAVEVFEGVARDVVRDVLLRCLGLVQPHARDLGLGEGRPGDDGVIGAKSLYHAEERVHRRVPGLVRSGMRELIRAGDIAAGVDVGIEGLEEFVGFDGARRGQADAQLLQTVARGIGNAPEGAQQRVERNPHLLSAVLAHEQLLAVLPKHAHGLVLGTDVDALLTELARPQLGDFGILANQQARQHLDLGHARAEPREALRELAADRASAEHDQPRWHLPQVPDRVRGQAAGFGEPRDGRHERACARGDADGPRGERPRAARGLHLHRPRGGDFRLALEALDTEPGVALGRVVRFDGSHDALHAFQ